MSRSIPITLDRERRLRFTFNAIAEMERTNGKSLTDTLTDVSLGFFELRCLVWCGLLHDTPALTVVEAGDLVQGYLEQDGSLAVLVAAVHDALLASGLLGKAPTGGGDVPLVSESSSTP